MVHLKCGRSRNSVGLRHVSFFPSVSKHRFGRSIKLFLPRLEMRMQAQGGWAGGPWAVSQLSEAETGFSLSHSSGQYVCSGGFMQHNLRLYFLGKWPVSRLVHHRQALHGFTFLKGGAHFFSPYDTHLMHEIISSASFALFSLWSVRL